MGNIMVIMDNRDVKMAITRDTKNLLTHVSNNLVCKIWVRRANEGCFEMAVFKLKNQNQDEAVEENQSSQSHWSR